MINAIGNYIGQFMNSGDDAVDVVSQINSFQSGSNSTHKVYVQKSLNRWRVWSPIDGKYAQFYETEKELSPDDEQWESVTEWGLMRYFEVRLPDSKTGVFGNATGPSGFANSPAATVTIAFTGTGLHWSSRKDNTGQPWNYVITNTVTLQTYTGSFSTFNTTSIWGLTLIREDLPYGSYTCTCTVGAFAGFPWCGLAIDGSFFDESIFIKCFWIVGSPTPNCCNEGYSTDAFNPKTKLRGGHQFFAFSTKAISSSGQNNWIPNHSTVETASVFANLATDRLLRINNTGSNLITSMTTNVTYAQGGATVVLRQVFKGQNKDFPGVYCFDFTTIETWSENGLEVDITATTVTDLDASVLYSTMHDQSPYVDNSLLRYMLIDGQELDLSPNPGLITVVDKPSLATWNKNILGVAKTGTDFVKSLASATYYVTDPASTFRTELNLGQKIQLNSNASTKKCYPTISDNAQVGNAVTLHWVTKITMGLVTDAYNTLKSTVNP